MKTIAIFSRMTLAIAGLLGLVGFAACNVEMTQDSGTGGNQNETIAGSEEGDPSEGTDGSEALNLAVFTDPDDPTFSTSDVLDVDDEVVRFDLDTKSIIWAADGTSYDAGLWTVDGNRLAETNMFEVQFGTRDGQRLAFFTEIATGTICDLRIESGNLRIFPTSTPVPQE